MTFARKTLGTSALATLAFLAFTPTTFAQNNDDPVEAQAFLDSGMTVSEAASAAKGDSGGTAMGVSWEHGSDGQAVFEVELVQNDGSVKTVLVDPSNGSVTAGTVQDDDDDDGVEGDDDDTGANDDGGVEGDDDD